MTKPSDIEWDYDIRDPEKPSGLYTRIEFRDEKVDDVIACKVGDDGAIFQRRKPRFYNGKSLHREPILRFGKVRVIHDLQESQSWPEPIQKNNEPLPRPYRSRPWTNFLGSK